MKFLVIVPTTDANLVAGILDLVLALAKVLSQFKEPPRSLLELWKPALVVGIPWALIRSPPASGAWNRSASR
jgi:hypothetical protein